MLAKLELFVRTPPKPLPLADETHIKRFLKVLGILPRRTDDANTGALRGQLMTNEFAGLPIAQIDWMANEALRRFTFFPSIHELTKLAAEWKRSDDAVRARAAAANRIEGELQMRLEDVRRRLKWEQCEQGWIDSLPDHIKRTMLTERLLKRQAGSDAIVQGDHYFDWMRFKQDAEAGILEQRA